MHVLMTHALAAERVDLSALQAVMGATTVTYCETGVGKVNAALSATLAASAKRPDVIVNVGTAGSLHLPVGSLVWCSRFVDRDMFALKAFGLAYEHDFSAAIRDFAWLNHLDVEHVCNTGDSFVMQACESTAQADVVDMENFAVAALCARLGIPLVSLKYVTDTIGQNSVQQWSERLVAAQTALQSHINQFQCVVANTE